MAMLITSVSAVRKATQGNEAGWRLFCAEQDIDPENPPEPEEGVCIDTFDLARYGMHEEFGDLVASVKGFLAETLSQPASTSRHEPNPDASSLA